MARYLARTVILYPFFLFKSITKREKIKIFLTNKVFFTLYILAQGAEIKFLRLFFKFHTIFIVIKEKICYNSRVYNEKD